MTIEEINRIKYMVCCPMCDNNKCVRNTDKCEAEIWAKNKAEGSSEGWTKEQAMGNLIHAIRWNDMLKKEAFKMAIQALAQEPCEDAISRQAAIDRIRSMEEWHTGDAFNADRVIRHIKDLPSVNPMPKTGHWINVNEGKWNTIPAYKCSACGANADLQDWSGESPFCPWCGAKMVESRSESE